MWLVPRIWDGADVWILGGGPSVASSFGIPEQVIYDVRIGQKPMSTFSDYMQPLHEKHIIGINVAYQIGDWIDIIFCGDKGFVLKNQKAMGEFPGMVVSCHSIAAKIKWMRYTPKDGNHAKGITPNPYKVSWNLNSGAASISLAAHLGAKRIILLGFDMKLSGETRYQHFHDAYKRGPVRSEDQKRKRGLPFGRHLQGFPVIKRDADKLGIEILNTSLNSAIECFKKVDIKQLL